MAKIFINYRNGTHAGSVETIADQLRLRFGPDSVFLDMHSIPVGARYPDELRAQVMAAHVLLAIIHPGWSSATDASGVRLIDRPGDWVRNEIAQAMGSGKLVVPVLVGQAPRLTADELPPDIRDLAHRQSRAIRRGSFTDDLRKLADDLARVPGVGPASRTPWLRIGAVAVAAVLLIVLGWVIFTPDGESPGGSTQRTTGVAPIDAEAVYLANLNAVGMSTDVRATPARFAGTTYASSLVYDCANVCLEPRSSVEYDLGKRYQTFEVVAGVLDTAFEPDQRGRFQVFLDGTAQEEVEVGFGAPRQLRVDVTGVLRLGLVAYREGTVTDVGESIDNQSRGRSNKLPSLAWGDPMVSG